MTEQSAAKVGMPVHSLVRDLERDILNRYGEGARRVEAGLCCPVEYDSQFISLLPPEIIEKNYGCGNPSACVSEGETVVDLGSGVGKICYILSQKVGPQGRVIGVGFNDEMLAVARKYIQEMGEKLGYRNVSFLKAKIQDLALDLELAERWLQKHPIRCVEQLGDFKAECESICDRVNL